MTFILHYNPHLKMLVHAEIRAERERMSERERERDTHTHTRAHTHTYAFTDRGEWQRVKIYKLE